MNATQQRIQTFFSAALAVLVGLFLLLLTSCNERPSGLQPTHTEKVENKINDALDRRPGEPVLDALENAADGAREVKTAIQEAVNDSGN